MRKIILPLYIAVLLFTACNNKADEADNNVADSTELVTDDSAFYYMPDSLKLLGTTLYKWKVDFDAKTIKPNPLLKNGTANVDSIIKGINLLHPDVQLRKVNMSNDTLYTEIPNSTYLGESIGDSGAAAYFAEAVINLTGVEGVKFVRIDFKEGSHASPGVWTRDDYRNYKEIK